MLLSVVLELLSLLLGFGTSILEPILFMLSASLGYLLCFQTHINSCLFHTKVCSKQSLGLAIRLIVLLELCLQNLYLVLGKSCFRLILFLGYHDVSEAVQ